MAAILIFCGLMLQLAPAAVRRPSILALVVVGVFTAVASPPNAR